MTNEQRINLLTAALRVRFDRTQTWYASPTTGGPPPTGKEVNTDQEVNTDLLSASTWRWCVS